MLLIYGKEKVFGRFFPQHNSGPRPGIPPANNGYRFAAKKRCVARRAVRYASVLKLFLPGHIEETRVPASRVDNRFSPKLMAILSVQPKPLFFPRNFRDARLHDLNHIFVRPQVLNERLRKGDAIRFPATGPVFDIARVNYFSAGHFAN